VAVIDGALTALASSILIMVMGPIGAPVGSLLTVVVVSLPWNLRILTKELNCSFLDLVKPIAPWALRFAPLLFLLGLLGTTILPTNYAMVAIGSAVVSLVYAATQWDVFKRSSLYGYVRRQLVFLERPAKHPELVIK
jgi:hypothetical protein